MQFSYIDFSWIILSLLKHHIRQCYRDSENLTSNYISDNDDNIVIIVNDNDNNDDDNEDNDDDNQV
jgi:hypothetical protein